MCRFTLGEDTEFEQVCHVYDFNFTNDIVTPYESIITESSDDVEEAIKQINETKSYQNIFTRFKVTNNRNLFYLKIHKRNQIIDIGELENISENYSEIYVVNC